MARIPRNSVGLAVEFAALSQLTVRGYDASMTLGNTKNIDILVFDPVANKAYQLEVKTNLQTRNRPSDSGLFGKFVSDWQMSEKHERIENPIFFTASCISTLAARIYRTIHFDSSWFPAPLSQSTCGRNISSGSDKNLLVTHRHAELFVLVFPTIVTSGCPHLLRRCTKTIGVLSHHLRLLSYLKTNRAPNVMHPTTNSAAFIARLGCLMR